MRIMVPIYQYEMMKQDDIKCSSAYEYSENISSTIKKVIQLSHLIDNEIK